MRRLALGLLLWCVLFSAPLGAREGNDPLAERSRFFGEVDVSVVNLDVVVTDRDGNPVDGLTRDDFRLLVDGEPVEILNFYSASEAAAQFLERSGANGAEASPDRYQPTSQRLWLVVYIDSSSIRATDRNRIISQLETLLREQLGHGDRVMLVSNTGSQEIRHQFGDPPENAIAALREISKEIGGMGQYESARLNILTNMARGAGARMEAATSNTAGSLREDTRVLEAETFLTDIYAWAQWRRDGLRASAARMEALLDALSGLQGRKALLYVGEGTPYRIGESLFQTWIDRYQPMFSNMRRPPTRLLTLNANREASRYSVQRDYARLAEHAAACRVAYYVIDAAQSTAAVGISAEIPGATDTLTTESSRWLAQQESLQRLVGTTGGRYIADLDRVDEVVAGLREDFSQYYSLGFAPPGKADGEHRSVRVELSNPDLRARHRSGFQAKSLDERMAEQLYAALYLGVAPNPLAISLELVDSEPQRKGRYQIKVLARIPMSSMLLIPQADELLGRATAWMAVANDQGGMSDVHGRRMPIRVPQSELTTAMAQDVGYTLDLVVGKGPQEVALVVRDELAVVSSIVTLPLVDGQVDLQ
jgi:VWFA-related protein